MTYDLCVIGAGWAGFSAAVAAARRKKSVCLIDSREVGGTCLNRGCIPAKVFVVQSRKGLSFSRIQEKRETTVTRLRQGMEFLLRQHKIVFVQGRGRIEDPKTVAVEGKDSVRAASILIATGSRPQELVHLPFDHEKVISSDDVFKLSELPRRWLVAGGGVLGCEFAFFLRRMGCEVTIAEVLPQLLTGFDAEIIRKIQQVMGKAGITISLGKGVESFDAGAYDKVLVAAGRQAVTQDLWSDKVKIVIEKGCVGVDRQLCTSTPNIYAAGDCIGGYMLAHVAAYEGELAVENIFGETKKRDYATVPVSVFTDPEMGAVGLTEEEAKRFGAAATARTVHFLSVGMAHVLEETQGFVKVIAETKSGRVLGAHVIGTHASELVNIFSLVIKNGLSVKDLARTVFAHPSISEVVGEVARSF